MQSATIQELRSGDDEVDRALGPWIESPAHRPATEVDPRTPYGRLRRASRDTMEWLVALKRKSTPVA